MPTPSRPAITFRRAVAVLFLLTAGTAAQPEDAPPKRVIPRGVVVDSGKQPVAGATAKLRRWTGVMSEALETVRTDAEGKFAFAERDDDVFYVSIARPLSATVSLHVPDELPMTVTLRPAVESSLQIRDANGNPLGGATVSSLSIRTPENGAVYVGRGMESAMEWEFSPSDATGLLRLPPLPDGALLDVRVMHPDWAQAKRENLRVVAGELGTVSLTAGVRTGFEFVAPPQAPPLPEILPVAITMWKDSSQSAASIFRMPFSVRANRLDVTAHPGAYDLSFKAEGFIITPNFSQAGSFKVTSDQPSTTRFLVRKTIPIQGRVIHRDGTPVKGAGVYAQIENLSPEGLIADASKWTHSEFLETDSHGEFKLPLVEGRCRVWVDKSGFDSLTDYTEIDVDSGRENRLADVVLTKLSPVAGRVMNEQGDAVPGAIVRLRHPSLMATQPTVSDDKGRFEIKLANIPLNRETETREYDLNLAAFLPDQPLAGVTRLDLRQTESLQNIDVILKADRDPEALSRLDEARWESIRNSSAAIQQRASNQKQFAAGVPGQAAPEIDGLAWLNTEARSLKEFRGKYVLLDFWFTGCGPCHYDFPSVKLVQERFADDNVAVIAVHDNSSTVDQVREHCKAQGLTFPIVVDHPDERVLKAYRPLGVRWFPTYILLDPAGNILANDAVSTVPNLRTFKLEAIRRYVLESQRVNE